MRNPATETAETIEEYLAQHDKARAGRRALRDALVEAIGTGARLNEEPDGLGYYYGELRRGDLRQRLDVLPPILLWHGDIKPAELSVDQFLVLLDGNEVARFPSVESMAGKV
jgi:hypothetical protein